MSGGQYFGYWFYSTDVNPRELRLGNIVWDYRAPTRNAPYQHGEDLLTNKDLFDPRDYSPLNVKFKDKTVISAEAGVQSVAFLGGGWRHRKQVRITSEKATEAHILSGQEDEFERLIIDDPQARIWLHRNLSAAYAAGARYRRAFRRPKLWLCTGLITVDDGQYKVIDERGESLSIAVTVPTPVNQVGVNINTSRTPTSSRKLGLSQKSIVAAQWMLLYCKNIHRKDPPGTPYMVKLSAKYAPDNVKGGDTVLSLISTSGNDIDRAEGREIELFYDSDDAEERVEDEDGVGLFEPMFPDTSSDEYRKFEETLQKLESE